MDGRCYSIVSVTWRGIQALQNVPRQLAEKILTAGYIKHEMRRAKIVGLMGCEAMQSGGWVSMCQRNYRVHLDVCPTLNM